MTAGGARDESMRVAVIGMSGRFSGATNLDEFWANLVQGVESVRTLPREELLAWGEDPALIDDPAYVPRYGTFEGGDRFDAEFFGYAPQNAVLMDPQQRVFLECAWEAMENAGYDARGYPGLAGVYAGLKNPDYPRLIEAQRHRFPGLDEYRISVTNDPDSLATRVSYKLGLRGPSMTILTACSTSLVAVHVACQALLGGECDIAMAGGIRLRVPRVGYLYREGGARSADGRCRAFDADANGVVGGEGVGVVVLKLLEAAIEDGDHVRAVVLGSAVNNDGQDRMGFTAPSAEGQARVIRMAQAAAQVDAGSISYVETHGTATHIGDPIEIAGLTRAFRADTDRRGYCAIGSVKTNIGHTDAAAGVAGLIKTVLSLEHGLLPPSLHFASPNPRIDFDGSPFFVNTGLRGWERDGGHPRRAGVSSFGMGGTNAHVVLEEAPEPPAPGGQPPAHLLVLSARTPTALDAATRNLMSHLDAHPEQRLADVAHTLQVGREAMAHRRFAVCHDHADARAVLGGRTPERLVTLRDEPRERPVVFMFPGQGAQRAGMARGLYGDVPFFRQQVDECCAVLSDRAGIDLRPFLHGDTDAETAARLEDTEVAQPALFVIEHSLARLWMHWGVTPAAMIGHSVGELVAATLAGVLRRDEALELVAARGRLMARQPRGSMLAVPLPEAEVRELLPPELAIASVNGPAQCVVSGPTADVDALAAALRARDVPATRLRTSHAFHSPMMTPVLPEFEELVRAVDRGRPAIPYVSNVTGTWAAPGESSAPEYWARHLRETVRFADGLATLLDGAAGADSILLEVGPGGALAALARRHPARSEVTMVLSSLPHAADGAPDLVAMLEAAGRLWLAGTPVRWPALHDQRRRRVPLPTYPFERQRHLVDMVPARGPAVPAAAGRDAARTPLAGEVEHAVAVLFAEVLGVEHIGGDDSFFELGGDSLVASQLIARVRETFAVPVPLESIFEAPTVAGLAGRLESMMSGLEVDETADEQLGHVL